MWDQISNNNRETKGESRGPSGRRERLADHLTQVVGIEPATRGRSFGGAESDSDDSGPPAKRRLTDIEY